MFNAVFSSGNVPLNATFNVNTNMSANFGETIMVTPKLVHVDTTSNWNAQVDYIGQSGHLYVYTDYTNLAGESVPGFKFGDGTSYLIDLPFVAGNENTSASVYVNTTAGWNAQPQLVGLANRVYVYSDYISGDGLPVPGMKIGDGSAYLIDLPFVAGNNTALAAHISDTTAHITESERLFWNNKVTCFISNGDEETVVFTKDNV